MAGVALGLELADPIVGLAISLVIFRIVPFTTHRTLRTPREPAPSLVTCRIACL